MVAAAQGSKTTKQSGTTFVSAVSAYRAFSITSFCVQMITYFRKTAAILVYSLAIEIYGAVNKNQFCTCLSAVSAI